MSLCEQRGAIASIARREPISEKRARCRDLPPDIDRFMRIPDRNGGSASVGTETAIPDPVRSASRSNLSEPIAISACRAPSMSMASGSSVTAKFQRCSAHSSFALSIVFVRVGSGSTAAASPSTAIHRSADHAWAPVKTAKDSPVRAAMPRRFLACIQYSPELENTSKQ